MSNIRISRPAAQNPTGLTPVAGYNKPATNTIGDFAQRQGITFKGQDEALSALEQSLQKNRELAQKFKGTRYEKVYQAQVEKLEKQLAQQKGTTAAATEAQALRDETAALQKEYEAAQAAKKASETEQAWAQFENAPKGKQNYDEIFRYRQAEREAQDAIARGSKPQSGNPAVPSTTYKPQAEALTTECHFPKPQGTTVHTVYQPPKVSAETIDAGLGIGQAPKSAQESAGVFIKRGIEDATKDAGKISAEAIDAALGIGAAGKSAQESAGVFIKRGIEDATKDAGKISAATIEEGLGLRNIPKSAMESYNVFEEAGKLGGENIGKQKGFFSKLGGWLKDKASTVGGFLKKHGGKLAVAAAIIGLGALLLNKCTGKKDGVQQPVAPVVPPTKPEEPEKPEEPVTPPVPTKPENKPIHEDSAPEPNYTLNAKYCGMSQYVAAAYGVEEGSDKHKQIMEKMWEVNPGLRNTTLSIGDKVYLPDVEINGETIKPDLEKQPATGKKGGEKLDKYPGYQGQEMYGVGEEHDNDANQYHDKDRQKVQDKANEAA